MVTKSVSSTPNTRERLQKELTISEHHYGQLTNATPYKVNVILFLLTSEETKSQRT